MFKFLGRCRRFMELTDAIDRRLMGSFPPATLVTENILSYTLKGGDLELIISELKKNCIIRLSDGKGLNGWKT